MRKSCDSPGCLRPAATYCPKHKWQRKNHGTLLLQPKNREREFWAKIRKGAPDDCWPWTTGHNGHGYGIHTWDGRQQPAHRIAYTLTIGPIPDGLQLDHTCHTTDCTGDTQCEHRRCCNPAHLQPVTNAENSSGDRARRHRGHQVTHCPKGHEYTPENTRIGNNGYRNCRTCERARKR